MQNALPSIAPGGASPLAGTIAHRASWFRPAWLGVLNRHVHPRSMQENSKRWDLTTLSRHSLSRIEILSTGANHQRRIVATLRKMSRICASGVVESLRAVHDEIGPPAPFGIRHICDRIADACSRRRTTNLSASMLA